MSEKDMSDGDASQQSQHSLEQNPYLDILGVGVSGSSCVIRSHLDRGRAYEHRTFSLNKLLFLAPLAFWISCGCSRRGRLNLELAVDGIIRVAQSRGTFRGRIGPNLEGLEN